MKSPTILDQSFWARFAETTWEKRSVTIKNIHSPLLQLDHSQIFKLLVIYSERCRRLKSTDGMKFYIEGHRQFDSEVLRHLPKKSDRNLFGYHERMNLQYNDYCLVCDELLQVNHDHQENLIEFASPLFANVGLPNRFSEMGLYLGNYRKTPFGVHEDACGVLSFPVIGKKKFRIWKPDFIRQNPKLAHSFSYAKYKGSSQVLEAYPGDMTYWPSSAWHIAESDGSFSATWSLGIWVDKKFSEVVSQITGAVLKNILGALGETRMIYFDSKISAQGEVMNLPRNYLEALSTLGAFAKKEMWSAFREEWMVHYSRNGFKRSATFEVGLSPFNVLRLRSLNRLVYWMKDDDAVIYAFNGSVVRSPSEGILQFITSLNKGYASRGPKGLACLEPLIRAGAFVKSV